jgi:Xaa-Pro aminopeptidase
MTTMGGGEGLPVGGGREATAAGDAAAHGRRLARARALAAEAGLDALLVGVGSDLRYLIGHEAPALERLTLLVLPVREDRLPRLLVPRLEVPLAEVSPAAAAGLVEVVPWDETEDPLARAAAAVTELAGPSGGGARAIALAVSDRLWAAFLLGLQERLAGARWTRASPVLRRLRMIKAPEELALLEAAARAADAVFAAISRGPIVGRSEAAIAAEVRERLVSAGHDRADFAIVASGPNSASPHHEPTERVVGPGEPVVFDFGGPLGGYFSDLTRTLWVTGGDPSRGPDPEFRRIYQLVQQAQSAAVAAVRPGRPAEEIDAVARRVIADAGLGQAFMHRTGHGIGLDVHEDPYLVAGNREPLAEGMTFSVEPGIYLHGRYGVRIEDIVACTADGVRVLNAAPRELLVVSG